MFHVHVCSKTQSYQDFFTQLYLRMLGRTVPQHKETVEQDSLMVPLI